MDEQNAASAKVGPLDAVQVRALGVLMEKQHTTPDQYPLTLKALVAACNQRSNRSPVVTYGDKTVARALQALRDRGLARTVSGPEMRVPKHYHLLTGMLDLTPPQAAVLCVLMLRGPQTVGELRGRSSRLYEFADLDAVRRALDELMNREREPLVACLPRLAGHKEQRYAHTLAPPPEAPADTSEPAPVEPATVAVLEEDQRLGRLEQDVQALRAQLEALREQFAEFRQQFE